MMPKANNVFIDTNVFIGAYTNNKTDVECIKYLYSLVNRGKRLYTSALCIAQCISVFQKKKTNSEIERIIKIILHRVDALDFTKKDISESLTIKEGDIEDNIQYLISKKRNCFYFVTNNYKDYRGFYDIKVVVPSKIRSISR